MLRIAKALDFLRDLVRLLLKQNAKRGEAAIILGVREELGLPAGEGLVELVVEVGEFALGEVISFYVGIESGAQLRSRVGRPGHQKPEEKKGFHVLNFTGKAGP